MPAPVTLPRSEWGDAAAPRRALLVHGLGSSGALMWRYAVTLADAGWHVVAVDLRGHGTAPRALDYTIDAYAQDVAAVHSDTGGPWDLVIGHSLGGAAAVAASARHPRWTRRLVLIDPAVHLDEAQRADVRTSQEETWGATSIEAVRAQHPEWHRQDVELRVIATAQASRWAVEQTSLQNPVWDVRPAAAALRTPTFVIAGDPSVYALFAGALAGEVLENPAITMTTVDGAGHSPHRDRPEATMRTLLTHLRATMEE